LASCSNEESRAGFDAGANVVASPEAFRAAIGLAALDAEVEAVRQQVALPLASPPALLHALGLELDEATGLLLEGLKQNRPRHPQSTLVLRHTARAPYETLLLS